VSKSNRQVKQTSEFKRIVLQANHSRYLQRRKIRFVYDLFVHDLFVPLRFVCSRFVCSWSCFSLTSFAWWWWSIPPNKKHNKHLMTGSKGSKTHGQLFLHKTCKITGWLDIKLLNVPILLAARIWSQRTFQILAAPV